MAEATLRWSDTMPERAPERRGEAPATDSLDDTLIPPGQVMRGITSSPGTRPAPYRNRQGLSMTLNECCVQTSSRHSDTFPGSGYHLPIAGHVRVTSNLIPGQK